MKCLGCRKAKFRLKNGGEAGSGEGRTARKSIWEQINDDLRNSDRLVNGIRI